MPRGSALGFKASPSVLEEAGSFSHGDFSMLASV